MDGDDNNDAFTNVNLTVPFPDAVQEFVFRPTPCPHGTNLTDMAKGGLHLNLTDAKLGAITTALDPRILQFALKLIF